MDHLLFERIVAEELSAVLKKYKKQLSNLVFLIEKESSDDVLGLYTGIPKTVREYPSPNILPDTITFYYHPILTEAKELVHDRKVQDLKEAVRLTIRETLWHELGHYFGLEEHEVIEREKKGTNQFT